MSGVVGSDIDNKVLARGDEWPGTEAEVRKGMDTEVRKRQVSLEGAEKDMSLAKVLRTEAGGLPSTDDGWEVWLKIPDNTSSLGRQAQNQILDGMSRVKTSLSLAEVLSLKAQLSACKTELRAERGTAVTPVAPVATPMMVTVASVLEAPTMA